MTIAFEGPDDDGWIVAQVVEVPGAISQGRTREEARENVIDALRLMLERHLATHGCAQGCRRRKAYEVAKRRRSTCNRCAAHKEIGPGLVRTICRQLEIPAP